MTHTASNTRAGRALQWGSTPLLWALVLGVVALGVHATGEQHLIITLGEMLIRLVAVVGIYTFIGHSGIVSFGHVGFMALGAYTAAWVGCDPMWKGLMLTALPTVLRDHAYGLWVSLTLATTLCGLVAGVLGLALMKLSGIAATIATFGFLIILNSVFSNWDSLTAGTSSIIGIPTTVDTSVAWAAAVAVIAAAWWFQNSRRGLMLQATRDSEPAAQSVGIHMVRVRLFGFVLSAGICGLAGALYAHFVGFLSPDAMYLDTTFILLSMLVIGGMQSLSGAILGTLLVSALIELLRMGEAGVAVAGHALALPSGSQQLALALSLALVLLVRPSGVLGRREWSLGTRNRPAA